MVARRIRARTRRFVPLDVVGLSCTHNTSLYLLRPRWPFASGCLDLVEYPDEAAAEDGDALGPVMPVQLCDLPRHPSLDLVAVARRSSDPEQPDDGSVVRDPEPADNRRGQIPRKAKVKAFPDRATVFRLPRVRDISGQTESPNHAGPQAPASAVRVDIDAMDRLCRLFQCRVEDLFEFAEEEGTAAGNHGL